MFEDKFVKDVFSISNFQTSDLDKVQIRIQFFFIIYPLVQYDKKNYGIPSLLLTISTKV